METVAVPAAREIAPEITPKGWVKTPTLLELKQDLTEAQTAHSHQEGKINTWLDNLHVRGAALAKTAKGNSKIVPKLIRKQAEWRYSALSEPFLSTDDVFQVDPTTWEDVESATQNRLMLNNQINTKIKKVRFFDRYVRAAVNTGTAIVRIGWEFEERTKSHDRPAARYFEDPSLLPMHEQLAAMKEEDPTRYEHDIPHELQTAHDMFVEGGIPIKPVLTGESETVEETYTVRNNPTLTVCKFTDVVIDPSCQGDQEKCQFIIYSFVTSQSELKKEGRYQNLDNIQMENASPLADPDAGASSEVTGFNFKDDSRKKMMAHEYWGFWDFMGTGIAEAFVATWIGNTMIRMERNPYPDQKLPFVIVPFLPVDDSVYGEPDGELLEDNQKVIGAVTRGMIDVMAKSANGQTGMKKGMLDATNRFKFLNGQDYEFNGNADPRSAIHMHTFAEIPTSAQFMLQQQSMEAESMSGVKAFSNGIDGNSLGDSVGNGRSVLDAASKRETGILRRLAEGVTEIGRKMLAMNGEFLEEEEVVRVTNDKFVPIRRDDLAGNYDIKLGISTAEEDNEKATRLEFMLQTMGPNADPGMSKIVLTEIARLRKMPELGHAIEIFEPTPDPMQQQIQQLEMLKLQAEIGAITGKATEAESAAILNQAKAITEQAKARHLGAQADQSTLDFVEQETGTTQEREKEKLGVQAAGNIDLETHKARIEVNKEKRGQLAEYLKGK